MTNTNPEKVQPSINTNRVCETEVRISGKQHSFHFLNKADSIVCTTTVLMRFTFVSNMAESCHSNVAPTARTASLNEILAVKVATGKQTNMSATGALTTALEHGQG